MFQSPELDLQKEMYDLLFTDKDCTPIKIPIIHKKVRRDVRDYIIKCKCTLENGLSEGTLTCPYCHGDGYISDEKLIEGYFMISAGRASKTGENNNIKMLFTDSTIDIKREDRIYIIRIREDGKIDVPIKVKERYFVYRNTLMRGSDKKADYNLSILWD